MFFVDEPASARELWKSDGTESGTVRVKAVAPVNGGSSSITVARVVRNTLFFAVATVSDGTDLWMSDGTEAGTGRIGHVTSLESMTAVNDTLFFVANEAQELWKSDGTEAGTVRVVRIAGSRGIEGLTDVRGTLVFFADGAFWRSDGTEGGTTRITDGTIDPDPFGDLVSPVASGARLFFAAHEPVSGTELWGLPLTALGCGNGVRDPGEACDEESATATCDADCTIAECGDGTVNTAADEACDPGDPLDGHCCTEECTLEPIGTTCSSQNVCDGIEACDVAGRCQPGRLLDCNDANVHTTDTCDAGRGCRSVASCGGDCNADGVVRVDELVTLVRVALEQAPLPSCVAGDTDGNGTIVVNEVVAAVGHGLSECPAPTE
jgi:ELWxxDGT repeat protein